MSLNEIQETIVEKVTFFEDRARVYRSAVVELKAGVNLIKLSGVSVLIADDTLQTGVEGDAKVTTASVRRTMHQLSNAPESEVDALQEKVDALAVVLDGVKRDLKRANASQERASGIERTLLSQIYEVRDGLGESASSLSDTFATIDESIHQARLARTELLQRKETERKSLDQAKLSLTTSRLKHPEISTVVEVQVEAETAGSFTITLAYFVPCALWRPAHVAKLTRNGDASEIRWETVATVWQRTGEVWENVTCEFSTARPGSAASAPLLVDDVIRTQPKTDKTVHVAAREVEVSSAGEEGGVSTAEMPGVDDGGEPLVLTADSPVSITSNGQPFRAVIGIHTLPCKTSKVVTPLLSPVPHIHAKATWSGDLPILAGPVSVVRAGAYVGRAEIGFVPSSEAFEIGFGVDSDVTVRFQVDDEHDSTLTGRNIVIRETTLFLNNLSDVPNKISVRVRIPVSEIEDVKVKTKFGIQDSSEGFSVREGSVDKDGFVELAFDLEPNCTAEYGYEVKVDAGRKVSLSF